jgi:transposase
MEKRKKDPSRQRGYQAFEIDFPSQYQRVSYPFRLIFVKSDGKIQWDKKSRDKHLRWIEKELAQLRGHLGHPRNQNRPQLMKRLQRILARYPEGKYYQVKISPAEGSVKEMEVIIDREAFRQTEQLDGLYVMGTTLPLNEASLDKVFTLYKQQYHSEQANRHLKGPVRVRPIFLQNPKRIEALLFVIFLALLAYMLMERVYRADIKEPREKKRTTRQILSLFWNYCITICEGKGRSWVITNAFHSA